MQTVDVSTTVPETIHFEVTDVTNSFELEAREVQASLPVSQVASSLAVKLNLPENVPWGLRNDAVGGAFLEDDRPIGEVVEPGSRLTVFPKTHLA